MMRQRVGGVAAEPLPQPLADVRVRLAGLRRGRVPPGADRPDRLVGDDQRGRPARAVSRRGRP